MSVKDPPRVAPTSPIIVEETLIENIYYRGTPLPTESTVFLHLSNQANLLATGGEDFWWPRIGDLSTDNLWVFYRQSLADVVTGKDKELDPHFLGGL